MFEWKSQLAEADYSLQMNTDNKELYKAVEKLCQKCVDISTQKRENKIESVELALSGWISAKLRKPESHESILIFSKDGGVAEGCYSASTDTWTQYRWSAKLHDEVLYWMPFPKSPESVFADKNTVEEACTFHENVEEEGSYSCKG